MPVHDWSLVEAGLFHDFHHAWVEELKRSLNAKVLPAEAPRSTTTTLSAPCAAAKYEAHPPTVPAPTTTRSARSLATAPLSSGVDAL